MRDFRLAPIARRTIEPQLQRPGPNARWLEADACPGFPCRVSLEDAEVGERVLALHYEHHGVGSPYRASGPIFVRAQARTATPAVNEIPPMFEHRLLSVRGYDQNAMMIAAQTTPGDRLADTLHALFADPAVRYAHLHNAAPGCFACLVERVQADQSPTQGS